MIVRPVGRAYPRLASARSIRWTLSRTANSGSPTRITLGSPGPASTSTSTGTASIPTRANDRSLASMGEVGVGGVGGTQYSTRRRFTHLPIFFSSTFLRFSSGRQLRINRR